MKKVPQVKITFEERGEMLDRLLWQFLCQNAALWQETGSEEAQ